MPQVIAALFSPVFVLALFWIAARLCQQFAPGAFPAVAIGGLLLWLGTIYLVGRAFHRLLWRGRVTEAGPWGKVLLTSLGTVLWFGVIAQLLALVFPAYFRRP